MGCNGITHAQHRSRLLWNVVHSDYSSDRIMFVHSDIEELRDLYFVIACHLRNVCNRNGQCAHHVHDIYSQWMHDQYREDKHVVDGTAHGIYVPQGWNRCSSI
eukprot:PhF_6_TR8356/c0_g1_i1/m.13109